jgi:uncharacterized protein YxeA
MKRNMALNLTFIVLIVISTGMLNIPFAESNKTKDNYFVKIVYSQKLYAKESDTWSITIYNVNCSENESGEAWFFFRFYLDGELWWNEYENTSYKIWRCDKGRTVTHSYYIKGWDVLRPLTRDIKIELYWYYDGEQHFKDSTFFSIDIILHLPLKNIYPLSYLTIYLIACLILLAYFHFKENLEE